MSEYKTVQIPNEIFFYQWNQRQGKHIIVLRQNNYEGKPFAKLDKKQNEITMTVFTLSLWKANQKNTDHAYLDGASIGDDSVLHFIVPQTSLSKVLHQVLVCHLQAE